MRFPGRFPIEKQGCKINVTANLQVKTNDIYFIPLPKYAVNS